MSASAIVMMCIACIGLWGGIAVSLVIMMKSNKAKAAAETEEVREQVDRVRMQPLYLQCMRHKTESLNDGTWDELKRLMLKYKAFHREGYQQAGFFREFEEAARK